MIQVEDLPVPEPAADDVRATADRIMARAEFNEPEPLLDRLAGWLDRVVSSLFDTLSEGGVGSFIAWLLLAAFVAALVYVMARWLPGPIRRSRAGRNGVEVDTPARSVVDRRNEAQWRALADEHLAAGRYEEAYRARYRALLAHLIDAGVLADEPGRTPREYQQELAQVAPVADTPFAELTENFEQVWYSPAHADERTVLDFGELEARVLAGARS